MGGYGAILFGNMLEVDRVISFAPQSYINRWNRLINRERRWEKQIRNIYFFQKKERRLPQFKETV